VMLSMKSVVKPQSPARLARLAGLT
jgi:hypothetical protein